MDRDAGTGDAGADSGSTAAAADAQGGGVADSAGTARDIRTMLDASAGAWNAGDLEGFLDDYTGGPDLTFVGSAGVLRGLEEVRERYLESYWAEGAERDSLRFEDLEVRPLGEDHAVALGRYVLHRPAAGDSVTATGVFTLVLRREEGRWKILHDHTS